MQCSVAKWKRNADNRQVGFALTLRWCGIQAELSVGNTWAWPESLGKKGVVTSGNRDTGSIVQSKFQRISIQALATVVFELKSPHAESESSPQSEHRTRTNLNQVCGPAEGTEPQGTCPGKNPWAWNIARSKLQWNLPAFIEFKLFWGIVSLWWYWIRTF